jgi:hypothetical protein
MRGWVGGWVRRLFAALESLRSAFASNCMWVVLQCRCGHWCYIYAPEHAPCTGLGPSLQLQALPRLSRSPGMRSSLPSWLHMPSLGELPAACQGCSHTVCLQ